MITEQQFRNAAFQLNCEIAVIKAVYFVEANGSGYLDDGSVKGQRDPQDRVKILFEGHRFWKRLVKEGKNPLEFIAMHPEYCNVLYKDWDRTQYRGGAAEWDRMSHAIEVCNKLGVPAECALDSASYGAFQIMGENAEAPGYASAQEMLAAFNLKGEEEQLIAFCRFVKSKGLDKYLRDKNFAKFAEGYNGTAYRKNLYDVKLINAYRIFKST